MISNNPFIFKLSLLMYTITCVITRYTNSHVDYNSNNSSFEKKETMQNNSEISFLGTGKPVINNSNNLCSNDQLCTLNNKYALFSKSSISM